MAYLPHLPTDPINDQEYHYIYCATGGDWEINAKFETRKYKKIMLEDGGDSPELLELGTKLTICPAL
jgi:hypothetical protein